MTLEQFSWALAVSKYTPNWDRWEKNWINLTICRGSGRQQEAHRLYKQESDSMGQAADTLAPGKVRSDPQA